MASMAQPSFGLSDRAYSRRQRTVTFPDRGTFVGRDQTPRMVVVECDPGRELADWFEPVLEEFERIINLPTDWDGYGSEPIALETVVKAFELLSILLERRGAPPWVVPLSDGGIQLEWKRNGLVFEIEIPAGDSAPSEAFLSNENSGESWEGSVVEMPKQLLLAVLQG